MADSVAVVLRRSHQKSKHGCQTCKRRRVKCDELHPACQRCHKGGLSCVYSSTVRRDDDGGRTVSWPSTINQSCLTWKETGVSPFPALRLNESPRWDDISVKELRYLYQIGLVESMLRLSGTSNLCPPWGDIPMMFRLTRRFDFVTYTLIAASASRLATISKSREAAEDATRYHEMALEGIDRIMLCLTQDNADAVLGATLVCSYTMSDTRSLTMLAKFGCKVSDWMQKWSHRSIFHRPLSSAAQQARWTASWEEKSRNTGDVFDVASVSTLLIQGIDSLRDLGVCFRDELNFAAMVRHLRDVLRVVHRRLGTPTATHMPVADLYRTVQPFTCWFTRDAASCYTAVSRQDLRMLTFLLHIHAVVLALTVALPTSDFSIFASFRVRAVLEICQVLEERQTFWCPACNVFHQSHQLGAFPLAAVKQYRQLRRGVLDLMA